VAKQLRIEESGNEPGHEANANRCE
jgi:hypothetical protein